MLVSPGLESRDLKVFRAVRLRLGEAADSTAAAPPAEELSPLVVSPGLESEDLKAFREADARLGLEGEGEEEEEPEDSAVAELSAPVAPSGAKDLKALRLRESRLDVAPASMPC